MAGRRGSGDEDQYFDHNRAQYDAAREDELRYQRYAEAARMAGAAGVMGEGQTAAPPPDFSGPGSVRAVASFRQLVEHATVDVDDVSSYEDEDGDREGPLLSPPGGVVPPGPGGLPGIQEGGEDGADHTPRHTGRTQPAPAVNGVTYTARASPFGAVGAGTHLPLGADSHPVSPPSRTSSKATDTGAAAVVPIAGAGAGVAANGSRRLSDVLGQTLSPGQCEKAHITMPVRPASKSLELQVPVGAPVKAQAAVLASLAPDQQMVLSFSHVSSWVQVPTGYGAGKKSLKDTLRPSAVAGAVRKQVHDAMHATAKGAASASSMAGRVTTSLLRIRGTGSALDSPGADLELGFKPRVMGEGYRRILHDITGTVRPGEVLALMGPSGSGKTSLLSILGGRSPTAIKLDGVMTVNGQRMSKAARKRIGFVLQDDVLYETLTVRETLEYAGLLRLPRSMSKEDKMARVDAVIDVLGLTKSKDTIIGGFFRRGVSGGERKRVSVGHELLINPAVLLLDEPTSGLDSTTALHLVTLLRELAAGGRAILTTIHQPSSRLYRQLDRVMLLAEGHIMYYGDALRAIDWFDHLGFGLPYGTNLADHILDCAMGEVSYDDNAPGAVRRSSLQHDAFGVASAGGAGKDKSVRGPGAVRSLYNTFEHWFATHPEGFTVGKPLLTSADQQDAAGNKDAHSNSNSDISSTTAGSMERSPSGQVVASLLEGVQLCRGSRRASLQAPQAHSALVAGGAKGASMFPAKPAAVSAVGATAAPAGPVGDVSPTQDLDTPPSTTGLHHRQLGKESQLPSSSSGRSSSGEYSGDGATGGLGKPATTAGSPAIVRTEPGAPWMQQTAVLWRRAINVRRFEAMGVQQWVQILGVAFITGLLWFQRGDNNDIAGASDVLGLLFFEMLFVSFRSLFGALFTFPNEYRLLLKERPSGMYQLSAYYAARTFADLPIELFLPTIYCVILYWLGGLRPTAAAFFSNWAVLLLVVLTAQSWGLLVGGVSKDPKTGQTITTIIMLTFMLVGGFYVRDVPVWIGWIKYLSFVYFGNNLFVKIQYQGTSLTDCANANPATGVCPVIPPSGLQDALRLPVDPNAAAYPDILALLGMLAVLRYGTYLVLKWKTAQNAKTL